MSLLTTVTNIQYPTVTEIKGDEKIKIKKGKEKPNRERKK